MATKAQKRAAGEARAKVLAEESRLSGLRAQKDDQNRRAKKQQEIMAKKAEQEKQAQGRMNALKIAVIAEALEGNNTISVEELEDDNTRYDELV